MADLRINGWSDESLKCQPDLDQTLTLAGKSRFWYQIAPGALRPGFMPILVSQSSWWGRESWLLCLVLSSWCLVMVVWLFLAVPCCDGGIFWSYSLFLTKFWAWSGSRLFEPVPSKHLLYQSPGNWRFAGGPIVARDGMLARYSCKLVMMTNSMRKKESAWKC